MRTLLRFIVRSKKDKDALEAAINAFYTGWKINIYTLKGARTPEKIEENLLRYYTDKEFILLLLGREDVEAYRQLIQRSPPNVAVHLVPKAKIRNARTAELFWELEKARATLRLKIRWNSIYNAYELGKMPNLREYELMPYNDIFFDLTGAYIELMQTPDREKTRNGEVYLVQRALGGLHRLYQGEKLLYKITIPDALCSIKWEKIEDEGEHAELYNTLKVNKKMLELYEQISLSLLDSAGSFDKIIVPWSGGKDSTAALLLALKKYGRKKVTAVYVNTLVDFPENEEYIEKTAKQLSIKLIKTVADLKTKIRQGALLPTHENRWCTGEKIEALKRTIREIADGKTLVVSGDRDSESRARSKRPPIRKEEYWTVASPLKLWSTAHVQLYLLINGVPLNPLYHKGFYRLGCYICPSLRSWEIKIIQKYGLNKDFDEILYKKFITMKKAECISRRRIELY
ncbi:MAG: phosphoadenosine phosphosulfate reductase family protein [Thermoproteales archaeon]|nr:phosphoadenosine phosphosulfate reductase family protein [Thermoproteales archaeon]